MPEHSADAAVRPFRSVATVIDHGVAPFEFAIGCEVFGIDRTADGVPPFTFSVCSPTRGPVRSSVGASFTADHDLAPLADADLVLVPAIAMDYHPGPALVAALQAAVARGATVASVCSGAFVLGHAGLLDGRRATTHWMHLDRFRDEFPGVDVVPDVLYVVDGPVATSAGTAAGIDLCLHLVRRAFGAAAANTIARRMIVPPHRDGGQAQFVDRPVPECAASSLAPVLEWAVRHLDADLGVPVLARRAAMSERTFARRFREETGTTPHAWVLRQRVALAEQLLETGELPVDEIARRCGFGSATMLRHHFTRARGIAPTRYRRIFSEAPGAPGEAALATPTPHG